MTMAYTTPTMGLKDVEVYKHNPFDRTDIHNVYRKVKSKGFEIVDKDTGEVHEFGTNSEFGFYEYDKKKFVKVFDEAILHIRDLKISGVKMLCYMMTIVERNRDYISIDLDAAREFCGYQNNKDVYKGIVELVEKSFIAKKVGYNEYFINSNMFFKGDRTKIYARRANT